MLLLLNAGAQVDFKAGVWNGAALQAASWTGQEDMVQLLLDRGAAVEAEGGYYGTALQAASLNRHEAVAGLLIDQLAK